MEELLEIFNSSSLDSTPPASPIRKIINETSAPEPISPIPATPKIRSAIIRPTETPKKRPFESECPSSAVKRLRFDPNQGTGFHFKSIPVMYQPGIRIPTKPKKVTGTTPAKREESEPIIQFKPTNGHSIPRVNKKSKPSTKQSTADAAKEVVRLELNSVTTHNITSPPQPQRIPKDIKPLIDASEIVMALLNAIETPWDSIRKAKKFFRWNLPGGVPMKMLKKRGRYHIFHQLPVSSIPFSLFGWEDVCTHLKEGLD